MKNRFLYLAFAAAVLFAACDDNSKSNSDPQKKSGQWLGTMEVTLADSSVFAQDSITVNINILDEQYLSIMMNQVQFSPKMPVKIDMTIDSVSYESGSGLKFAGNNIVPEAMGGPFPQYTITNLVGSTNNSGIEFSMICGQSPIKFSGRASD